MDQPREMIDEQEARSLILQAAATLPVVQCSLAEALGSVLAREVVSDVDSPPHDKSLVDGYAVCASDFRDELAELTVLEEVVAGQVPTRTVTPGTTTRIMTGAPIPSGADAVVMVERSELLGNRVRLNDKPTAGQNVMPRAVALECGQVVLKPGRCIGPAEIGLLAEVGGYRLDVFRRPVVAVLATGDELVDPSTQPAAGQIRNSNGPMLVGCVRQAGCDVDPLGVARDDPQNLRTRIEQGLQSDVLVLSGGVSAGVLDLVPHALADLGVRPVFHKVRIKPGKPVWFGVAPSGTLVFGLPGNPVSSYVGFQLLVRPALRQMAGCEVLDLPRRTATLAGDFQQRGQRVTYYPSQWDRTTSQVRTLASRGSADQRTLADADCLTRFAAGNRKFVAGEQVEVVMLPREPQSTGGSTEP